MARLRYNGLRATLNAALTTSGTTITFAAALTHLNGTAVPTITGTDYIPLCILSPTTGLISEIVYLTAYTTGATTGTITRAQEGTTGVVHSVGDPVQQSATVFDFGVSTSYTSAWTAAVGSTSLGTGGTNLGFYTLNGPICFFEFVITLGTSPGIGTSGQYSFSVPVSPARDGVLWGTIQLTTSANPYPLLADLIAGTLTFAPKALPTTAGNPAANMTPSTPGTPVATTIIRFSGTYLWTT